MSIGGRLEDLSVADMLQMLHLSRKSGVLRVESNAGAAVLYFRTGNITGARHPNRLQTVGRYLVELGFCSELTVAAALRAQAAAGAKRRPLVSQLVASGALSQGAGARVLEQLIEATVRTVVAWETGSFAFDPDAQPPADDDFEHVTDDMVGGFGCDTRIVLMDALRILDERNAAKRSEPDRPRRAGAVPPGDRPRVSSDVAQAETIPAPGADVTNPCSMCADSRSTPRARDQEPAPSPCSSDPSRPDVQVSLLHQYVLQMKDWQSATGASLTTLQFLSRIVDRCVLFVVRQRDLLGIGGFGLATDGGASSDLVAGFRMALDRGTTLHEVVTRGKAASLQDRARELVSPLLDRIGPPASDHVLLLPVMGDRKAIALVYCDFGAKAPSRLPLEAIEILVCVSGMALQLAMARSFADDEPLERELYRTLLDRVQRERSV